MTFRTSRHSRGATAIRLLRAMVLPAALAPAAFGAQAATAAWDSTLSKAIPTSVLSGATALPASQVLNVHVSLKIQNKAALDQLVTNLYKPGTAQYHQYLTPASFAAAFAPSVAQAQTVVSYLQSAGFSKVQLASNRLLVDAVGSVATIESAFNTKLVQASYHGRAVRANVADIQVPASLGGIVLAVLGPSNLENYQTSLEQTREQAATTPLLGGSVSQASLVQAALAAAKSASAASGSLLNLAANPSFPPTAWDIAYDAGNTPDASESTIAISTYEGEDTVVVQDLRQMERQFGLPYVPVEVRETPAFTTPTPTSSGDDEWDLDTQSSTAMAHNVKKLIIYATPSTTDLIDEYNTFATQADAIAGNMSYSACELLIDIGYVLPSVYAADQAFEQAAAEGLSWHASAGDNGGSCNVATTGVPLSGVPLISNYPATSPYVVGVGGTALFTDSSYNYGAEIAEPSGGGGISVIEAAPAWQVGIVPTAALNVLQTGNLLALLNPSLAKILAAVGAVLNDVGLGGLVNPGALGGNGIGRGVPDISMNFGFFTPEGVVTEGAADVIVAGSHFQVFGTSLSSPLAVGAWARLQSAHCGSLGFAAPAYYALDTTGGLMSKAKGFHDVTIGTNGDYLATPGWDYATGFGSIDISAVNAALPRASEDCTPLPTIPVAHLVASTATGEAPLNVSFNASASSDRGDTLAYYTIDFGDQTLPLQQTSPVFAAHTYSAPGTYTVSLTVRNSNGGVSAPVITTVTVDGTPAACSVPGQALVATPPGTDPSIPLPVVDGEWGTVGGELSILLSALNAAIDLLPPPVPSEVSSLESIPAVSVFLNTGALYDPIPSHNLLSASVAEPASMPGMLVFTMQVSNLSTVPPLTTWALSFTLPGAPVTSAYYVAMTTESGGGAKFVYGQNSSVDGFEVALASSNEQLGSLDPRSNYSSGGRITLVLPKSALGLTTGETLYDIQAYTAIQVNVPPGPVIDLNGGQLSVALPVDGATTPWGYTLIGNVPGAPTDSGNSCGV
jgi:PKD repeat protein